MKAITLWQPHASLIAAGFKSVETRTHNRFRGLVGQRIAIHAAARKVSFYEAADILDALVKLRVWEAGHLPAWPQRTPLSAIVCTAYVARFGTLTEAKHAKAACCHITDNRHGLFLEGVRKLDKPIPWKGGRGIFTVPDSVIPEYAR